MALIMSVFLIIICISAAVTDFYKAKIYNRMLLPAFLVGGTLCILYYWEAPHDLLPYLLNLVIAAFFGGLFFHDHLWGGGDSKLWILVCMLVPFEYYPQNPYLLFPSIIIFINTFLAAYVFVLFDTFWEWKKRRTFGKTEKAVGKRLTKRDFIAFAGIYFLVADLYGLLQVLLGEYFRYNRMCFALIFVLAANRMFYQLTLKYPKGILAISIAGYLMFYVVPAVRSSFRLPFDPVPIIVLITVILIRTAASEYNYGVIPTKNVKAGMILSMLTIRKFQRSRVKGLPEWSDETTKSRLTEEEAQAVRRWESSKYGEPEVITVRHIPFAGFIALGVFFFLLTSGGFHYG